MKLNRSFWNDFSNAAGLVGLAAALAYLPFARELGFFHDDWFSVASRVGGVYLTDMHAGDRPMMGWLYEALTRFLGERPLNWYFFSAFGRAFSGLVLWWIARLLWPQNRCLALLAGVFLVIYPGFLQLPNANNYSNHIVAYGAGLFSLALSLGAARMMDSGSRLNWLGLPLIAFSAVLSRLYPAVYETFIGLEAVRLILLWQLCGSRTENSPRFAFWPRVGRSLAFALPNLLAAGWFLTWRLFIFVSNRPATDTALLAQRYSGGGETIARMTGTFLGDLVQSLITAWFAPLRSLLLQSQFPPQPWAIILGLGLAGVLVFALWFSPQKMPEEAARAALWVGLASLAVTTLPVILAGREVSPGVMNDRYTFQSSAWVALTAAAGIGFLPRRAWYTGVAAGLIALALTTHTLNAANHREIWRMQHSMWWQLSWRAPRIQADTVLIPLLPEGYQYAEDFEIWAPANRIYQPQRGEIYLSASIVTPETLDLMRKQGTLGRTWRLIRYEKRYDRALVLAIPAPDACLRVLDGAVKEADATGLPLAAGLAAISKPERILSTAEGLTPPETIFGPEPEHNWCYYYQRAGLAMQNQDWQAVRDLYRQTQQLNLQPHDPLEWQPFYQALTALGDTVEAQRLADLIQTDKEAQP